MHHLNTVLSLGLNKLIPRLPARWVLPALLINEAFGVSRIYAGWEYIPW